MAGLTKEQRAAMLADEVDGGDPIDLPETPILQAVLEAQPTPPPAPVAVAAAAPAMDPMQLIKMLTDALTASNRETALTARNPIPESYLNGGFPAKSVFSHPDGDLAHPPTKLRCPMFLGVYSNRGEARPAFPIFEDSCRESERVMLNQLREGSFPVERNDGRVGNWRVIQESDELGEPIRLIIAIPSQWLSKEEQAQMPGQPNFLKQLTQGQTVPA